MPSVDNRVVEMQFDNKQFESGVSTSIKSLEKLKKGLDLDKSAKSLSNLEKTAKGFNLSGIANGVETIANRFSTLGIIGVTALQNITNAAMNAGARMVEALTLTPVKMGFQEYETQINAVQTILANTSSKGTTLQQVNNALDELNRYADLTIYNFTEMTRNIGTFTAAGVDLDTSVAAIKGIANLAAVSGSNSQQASTAMYQLSQALAAGTVKLQDWNSVVNAGMGGQVFQDSLKETARVHGIAIDQMIEEEGSFRETLQKGWLSSEILTETLAKFTGDLSEEQLKNMGYTEEQTKAIMKMGETANDAATKVKTFTQLFDTLNEAMQSGWTQSWEYIIGDYEEAKETLTQLSDMMSQVIQESSDARNQVLKEWSELGGRTELFGALLSAIEAIFSYIKPIQEGFKEIIPPITGQNLYDLTVKLHQFMESMKLTEDTANRVKEIAKNFAQAFKNVLDAVKNATGGMDGFKNGVIGLRDGILNILTAFSAFVKGLSEGINLTGIFSTILSGAGSGLSIMGRLLTSAANLISFFAQALTNLVSIGAQAFTNLLGGASSFADAFVQVLITVIQALPRIIGEAVRAVGDVIRSILQAIPIHEVNAAVQDTLFTLILANINKFLHESRSKVEETKTIFDKIGEIAEGVTGVLESVQGSIKSFARSIQADALLKIAIALGILAASLYALSQIPLEQLGVGLAAMATGMLVFTGIALGTIAILKKISGSMSEILKVSILATQLRKIAVSMLLFAGAVRILVDALSEVSSLSWDELMRGLVALAGISGIMIGINKLMSSVGGVIRMAAAMTILGAALHLFAGAVKELAELSWEELTRGLIGIAAGIGIMLVAMKLMENGTMGLIVSTIAVIAVSAALKILAETIKDFANIDFNSILKAAVALVAIAGSVRVLGAAVNKVNIWSLLKMIAVLIVVANTLKSFAEAATSFNDVEWASVAKIMVTMTSILATMAIFSAVASKTKFLDISGGLWAVSEAVRTFVNATRDLSGMDWPTLLKGIVGVVGGLGSMVFALNMIPENLIVRKAASLLVVSLAMRSVADALKTIGTMSFAEVAKGVLGYAGAMVVMVKALNALSSIKEIGKAGASLMLMGIGMSMIAGPIQSMGKMKLSEIAKGLLAMSASLLIVYAAVKVMGSMMKDMISTSISLTAMGIAITAFGIGLATIMYTVKELAGLGVEGMVTGIVGIAALIGTMYALIESVNRMPKLSPAAVGKALILAGVIGALAMVVSQLASIDSKSALEAATALSEMVLATSAALTILSLVQVTGAVKAIAALGVIIGGMSAIVAAMGALAQIPGAKWLMNEGKEFMQTIGEAIGGFFGAIAGGFIGTAMSVASSALPGVGKSLSQFATNAKPFFDTVNGLDQNLGNNVANLAAAVLMITGADVLSSATAWLTGGNSMEKFGQSLAKFAPYFKEYADVVKDIDPGAVEGSANAAKALAEMADALPKEGGLMQKFTGTSDIIKFANKLIPFGNALKEYSQVVKDLDVASIQNATQAAQGLADLYNSLDNIGGVVGWFEGERDMGKFGDGMVKLANALVDFSTAVSGNIDYNSVTQATQALQALSDLNGSLDNIGGIVSWFEGEKQLSYFAQGIKDLGSAISGYMNEVSSANFDAGKVTSSVEALKSLAEVNDSLNLIGGMTTFFQGSPDIQGFAAGIKSLGSAIAGYSEEVSGKNFDDASITSSVNALKAFAEIYNTLPTINGLLQFFQGYKQMGEFASGVRSLGKAIGEYSEEVSGRNFDEGKITASVNALSALAKLYEVLPEVGGLISFFEGEVQLDYFAKGITALGGAIAEYANSISQVSFDEGQMTASVNAIKIIAEAANILGDSGGWDDFGSGNNINSLSSMAGVLGELGSAIASFAQNIGDQSFEQIGPAVEAIKQVAEVCNSLNDFNPDGINKFKENISNLGDMGLPQFNEALATTAGEVSTNMASLRDAISEGAQGIGEAFDNLKSKLADEGPLYEDAGKTIGESLIRGLSDSIKSNTFMAVTAFETVCKNMIDAGLKVLTSAKARFTNAGRNLATAVKDGFREGLSGFSSLGADAMRGLASGISNNAYIAKNAAARAASDALAAAKRALDSNSPSKKFMELGEDSDRGLAIGMEKFTGLVTKSAANVANDAFNASSESIKQFNKLAVGAMLNPSDTVRPILDAAELSNRRYSLQTDALAKAAAFSTGTLYGDINPLLQVDNSDIINSLNDIQTQLNYIIQNGTNQELNMYVDGKQLANTIARPMNRALGSISKRGGIT